ncbi:MAG: ADP-ribosylglycohydrolase family protein [Clostridia bacterium]|nr:ADP-ribosylglycohydrolase family protein [Clostridia bacterium]
MYVNHDAKQPDALAEILSLRPAGADIPPRTPDRLTSRIKGALIGRLAGCMLGVPVENYSILRMQALAAETGTSFPPVTYWKGTDRENYMHYGINLITDYLEQNIYCAAGDDDVTYVMLNLLLLEKYGKGYSVDDVGKLWVDVLPHACTAEDEALRQLRAGTKAECAAAFNGFVEWIGAAIRADAFGYACAGDPVAAAKLCYNDAYLSHRKNGIYGEMFCAAAIAAAFTADSPLDAIRAGMMQIPEESELYQALQWAFSVQEQVTCYSRARMLIDEKYGGLHPVHTINNMVAIVFALMLGGNDYEKCISECIAIGLDNDCTGATVGSIVGAFVGIEGIPAHWYDRFNDTIMTYIIGHKTFSIEDTVSRFEALNGTDAVS